MEYVSTSIIQYFTNLCAQILAIFLLFYLDKIWFEKKMLHEKFDFFNSGRLTKYSILSQADNS